MSTTPSGAALPAHLAPLLGERPHIDVLGTVDPWVVPDGWMAETQARIRALAEDPRSRWGTRLSGTWVDGAEPIIWFAHLAASLLPAPLPLWAGTYVQLDEMLVAPWLKHQKIKTRRICLHWWKKFDDLWYLGFVELLLPDGPQARLDALDLTAEMLAIFEPVPHFQARARVLLSLLDRVREDDALRRIHTEGTFPEIVRCWRALATEEDVARVPELAGTAATLAWGVDGLDTAPPRPASGSCRRSAGCCSSTRRTPSPHPTRTATSGTR
ncbi:MAG: hypothetical protein ACRDQ0_03760 [Pseudonocardia sp.]